MKLGTTVFASTFGVALLATTAFATAPSSPPPPLAARPAPPLLALRAEENHDLLREVDPLLGWQRWKMLPFAPDRATYASVGADLRLRAESTRHPAFRDGVTDTILLQRWMAHASVRHREQLTVFAQLKGATLTGSRDRPGPNDQNEVDLHQAFVALHLPVAAAELRLGRQELAYGSSRLVGIRNGPNVRLSFDAVRLRWRSEDWQLDAFVAQPVGVSPDAFDDRPAHGEALWGTYARRTPGPGRPTGLETYYLGFRDVGATYRATTGEETRHTLGARVFGRAGAWDWDWEPMLQLGRFADREILAWSLGTITGYTFADTPLSPRLGLGANLISGDRGRGAIGTFNALYPRGAYFGEEGLIGPANLVHIEPSLRLRIAEDWTLTTGAGLYYRASSRDGLYNPGRRLTLPAGASDAREVGQQFSLETTWRPSAHWRVTAYASWFRSGDFVRESGGATYSAFTMLSVEASF